MPRTTHILIMLTKTKTSTKTQFSHICTIADLPKAEVHRLSTRAAQSAVFMVASVA